MFGSKEQLVEVNIQSFDVPGIRVNASEEPVRSLGAMFDSYFAIVSHVISAVKEASFDLRNIGKVRRLLTEDPTKKVMQNLIVSRIDYCNASLSGKQQDTMAKLPEWSPEPNCTSTLLQCWNICMDWLLNTYLSSWLYTNQPAPSYRVVSAC